MRQVLGVLVLVAAAACGPRVHMDPMPFEQDDPNAGGVPTRGPDAPAGAQATREVAPPTPPRPTAPPGRGARTGTIARASLNAVLDAGPGAFLHGFEVAPVMDGQRFAGWRLVQLMEGEHRFDGLDVAPGDVLLSVNGLPVSKPDQLAAVWDSLRAANQVVVALVRDHASLELRFAIDPPAGAKLGPMSRIVYWRRDLPPLSEQVEGAHEVEAESAHVPHEHGPRDAMWGTCYRQLMVEAEHRIGQEVERLGGSCAHVVDETVTAKVDDARGTFWLRGRFRYVMYVHPAPDPTD